MSAPLLNRRQDKDPGSQKEGRLLFTPKTENLLKPYVTLWNFESIHPIVISRQDIRERMNE